MYSVWTVREAPPSGPLPPACSYSTTYYSKFAMLSSSLPQHCARISRAVVGSESIFWLKLSVSRLRSSRAIFLFPSLLLLAVVSRWQISSAIRASFFRGVVLFLAIPLGIFFFFFFFFTQIHSRLDVLLGRYVFFFFSISYVEVWSVAKENVRWSRRENAKIFVRRYRRAIGN